MDLSDLFPTTVTPWVLFVGAVCAGITAYFPAPTKGPLVKVWPVLNFLALNIGHARNAEKTHA